MESFDTLLADVSRSFYLTLRFLPKPLQGPISLAYLLARATDTIADTESVSAEVRLQCLTLLDNSIQGRDDISPLLQPLERKFIPCQDDAGERLLLERITECLDWLASIPAHQQTTLRTVLAKITKGQAFDIDYFNAPSQITSIAEESELDEYTYRVAGCVGEFWTQMCFEELGDRYALEARPDEMKAWGIGYGKGLQLINILRDLAKDRDKGRCYLPFSEHGLSPEALEETPEKLQGFTEKWHALATARMDYALEYVCNLRQKRLRFATALPMLIGVRTLAMLKNASWQEIDAGVKIPRSEVKSIMSRTTIASLSSKQLRKLYHDLKQTA